MGMSFGKVQQTPTGYGVIRVSAVKPIVLPRVDVPTLTPNSAPSVTVVGVNPRR